MDTTKKKGSRTVFLRTLGVTARTSVSIIVSGALGRQQRDVCDKRLQRWAEKSVALAQARVSVHGLDKFDPDETFVVMSNHQSNFDILAIYYAYPSTLRMVAKQEMRSLPLIGAAMEAAEFIFVDRKNHGTALAAMESARERIQSGISVWIAPEGTRSVNGEVGPFKKGGFMLALSAGVRILPCTVVGTRDVMPVKAARVRVKQKIDVTFHEPIEASAYGVQKRDELMQDVRAAILSGLRE